MVGKRITVVLLGLALCLGAGTANATFPGTNGRIAFVSDRDGNVDVYSVEADGSGLDRLTTTSYDERNPRWSPEGHRLAFDADGYIYLSAADGSWTTKIESCHNDSSPAWSPEGDRLAFHRQHGKVANIYTSDLTGNGDVRVTGQFGGREVDWSPDGSEILFEDQQYGPGDSPYGAIWTVAPDGSNGKALTSSNDGDSMPSWSPDGTRIAFVSARGVGLDVYVMAADGRDVTQLTDDPASDFDPVWSPDGTRIAFVSGRDGDPEIFTMDDDGSNIVQVTDNDALDMDPDWQARPSTAEPPGPPEGPERSCRVLVERSISLDLDEHLRARGEITNHDDNGSRCTYGHKDVSVQRRTGGRWKNVAFPNELLSFDERISDRPGRYRAVVERSRSTFYADRYVTVCSRAVSRIVRHKH